VQGALSTGFRLTKLHSGQPLAGSEAEQRLGEHALIVLNDYPARHLTLSQQEAIAAAVERDGHGLLMIGGYNGARHRDGATVLIEGHRLRVDAVLRPRLEQSTTPLLSVWQRGAGRVGALASDVMPHWAGGILDWGEQRVTLPTGNEIGHLYPAFLVDLCRWLANA
jgi:uncharacterized membrane protein